MGTRGIMGVRVDGQDKLAYNHYDSYPHGLGNDIVEVLDNSDLEELKVLAHKLVPSSSASVLVQGKLDLMLQSGSFPDAGNFICDSLFCEWAYIVDFDSMVLEVYKRLQEKPHDKGRYCSRKGVKDYYPYALVGTFPLKDIPSNWIEQVDKQEEEDAEEEDVRHYVNSSCMLGASSDLFRAQKKSDDLFVSGVVDFNAKTIVLYRGNLEMISVPMSWFEPTGNGIVPDFADFEIIDGGTAIRLGSYEASASSIFHAFDPSYQRDLDNLKEMLAKKLYGRSRRDDQCVQCGKPVDVETSFRDDCSRKEFSLTHWCQECQDEFFTDDDDEDE